MIDRLVWAVSLVGIGTVETAAASVTAVPRSLATALAPILSGWLLSVSPFGWPLVLAGGLKITYDLLLLRAFSAVRPPEEG